MSISFISVCMFVISFLVLTLGLVCSSISLMCMVYYLRSFFFFDMHTHFSLLRVLLLHSIRFGMLCFHFNLSQGIFKNSFVIFSVTYWLFRRMLFDIHVFGYFPRFPLLLISSFIALWSKKILDMISVLLNLLNLVLLSNIWSIGENVLFAL